MHICIYAYACTPNYIYLGIRMCVCVFACVCVIFVCANLHIILYKIIVRTHVTGDYVFMHHIHTSERGGEKGTNRPTNKRIASMECPITHTVSCELQSFWHILWPSKS